MGSGVSARRHVTHRFHDAHRRASLIAALALSAFAPGAAAGVALGAEPPLADAGAPKAEAAPVRAPVVTAAPANAEPPPHTPASRMLELAPSACPEDMVFTRGICIDRYESSMVDKETGEPLSPYYPPHPKLMRKVFGIWEQLRFESGEAAARRMPLPAISSWQKTHDFVPKALSVAGQVPQAYVSYHTAKRACQNAGKRLCTSEEWVTACRGRWQTNYPYGNDFRRLACNVYRYVHPAHVLHGLSQMHQLDPRFNLIVVGSEPLLRDTGSLAHCESHWWTGGAHDMVGNLDEWIEDEKGVFRGGFYARATTKGCDAQVASHEPDYFDYSTGARCCLDPLTPEARETH